MTNLKTIAARGLALFVSAAMCLGILQNTASAAVVDSKVCGQEVHTHNESCYGDVLSCTLEETAGHTHGEDCFSTESTQTCTLEESQGHAHGEDCYTLTPGESVLTCTEEEGENHAHGEGCYTLTPGESTLTCTEEEAEGHAHGAECFTQQTVQTCTLEEAEGHVHGVDCYQRGLVCGKEEHTHASGCFSADGLADQLYKALQNTEDKDVVLILNGVTLDLDNYTGGNIRVVTAGQTLTIQDGDVAGGTIQGTGSKRVITILNGGTVNLTGSTVITGGGHSGGAGVFVGQNSTFNMAGGEISGNVSADSDKGGGVLVEGAFNMSGGTIRNNQAGEGGGIFVDTTGHFTMRGGAGDGNTAKVG